ncbi:MAG: hypothetical protein GY847_02245 [Proteobacteria bacterium]|nr:hypothetical protein [Pseudomonadota bacterium]
MAKTEEKRANFRRYEDRRMTLLLSIHELLFDNPTGQERDRLILEAVRHNFKTDRTAFVIPEKPGEECSQISAVAGNWDSEVQRALLKGSGLEMFWSLQKEAPGAITLTRVKRPTIFPFEAWESLWNDTLATLATAILSVQLISKRAPMATLWLLQTSYSREWSSRDRDLAEEVAVLLAKVRDKETSKQ